MFRNLLILALVTLALGAPRVSRRRITSGRIVGGNDTDIAEHPHQVALEWHGSLICGGSLIAKNYVITSVYCTDGSTEDGLTVRLGTSRLEAGGVVKRVKKINENPKYNFTFLIDFDISVLEIEPVELGDTIQPIALPEEGALISVGTTVNVTGWGVVNEDDWTLASQLQVVQMQVVSNADCQIDYYPREITDRMLCAGVPEGGKGNCYRDFGGPLSADGVLWGIVSWGHGCAEEGFPGVYGNVTALRSFVDEVVPNL